MLCTSLTSAHEHEHLDEERPIVRHAAHAHCKANELPPALYAGNGQSEQRKAVLVVAIKSRTVVMLLGDPNMAGRGVLLPSTLHSLYFLQLFHNA